MHLAQSDLHQHSRSEKGCCREQNPASPEALLCSPGVLSPAGQSERARQEKMVSSSPAMPAGSWKTGLGYEAHVTPRPG